MMLLTPIIIYAITCVLISQLSFSVLLFLYSIHSTYKTHKKLNLYSYAYIYYKTFTIGVNTFLKVACLIRSSVIVSAKKINKAMSEVRWTDMSAIEVYNLHRALHGIYPLTTKFRDKLTKLFDAFIDSDLQSDIDLTPGTIQYCNKTHSIKVLCKDRKYVNFKSIRIVGKREITALDFFNGYIKNMSLEKRQCIAFRN